MRYAISLLMVIFASGLWAQTPPQIPPGTQTPDPSPAKESFVIQPGSVDPGVRGFALRFVANDSAGFANSSSKQPDVTFSAGVTLVPGSFQLLNQNEAQCSIDVDDQAAGTIEVKLNLYSVNGSNVLTTLRATLGIKGTTPVSGSQAKVGAESVLLVVVNSTDPQPAGVILISGSIAGSVSIKAPTGCQFAQQPTAKTDAGSINSPKLEQANTIFSFAIGNASLDKVNVRVEGIQYNTQYFGLVGGVEGDLACEVSGAALSSQTALVINAFTAKTEVAGSNDNGDPAPAQPAGSSSGSQSSDSTTPTTSNPVSGGGAGLATSPQTKRNNNPNNPNNQRTQNNGRTGRSYYSPPNRGGSRSAPSRIPAPRGNYRYPNNRSRGFPNRSPNRGPTSGGAVGAGGSSAEPAGTGSISDEKPKDEAPAKKLETTAKPKKLQVAEGLHFCDKDFQPVTALVLDKMISNEAGGRVWIVLKLKKDKNPDKVETVTVKLTVNGVTRELALTETGKHTGEFRCGKDGILVVADKNPDSNTEKKAAQPPKPRYPR